MAKIRHITLTTQYPTQVADFYKEVFDMKEVHRRPDHVVLTDGYIAFNIRQWKTEKDADLGPNGPNYSGLHHIGFQVDDLDQTCKKLERAKAKKLSQEGMDAAMMASPGAHRVSNDMKWAGPDDQPIDISRTGWRISS